MADLFQDQGEVDRVPPDIETTGLDPGEVQELIDERKHAPPTLLDVAEAHAREWGCSAVFLDSRTEARASCQREGYAPHGSTLVRKLV